MKKILSIAAILPILCIHIPLASADLAPFPSEYYTDICFKVDNLAEYQNFSFFAGETFHDGSQYVDTAQGEIKEGECIPTHGQGYDQGPGALEVYAVPNSILKEHNNVPTETPYSYVIDEPLRVRVSGPRQEKAISILGFQNNRLLFENHSSPEEGVPIVEDPTKDDIQEHNTEEKSYVGTPEQCPLIRFICEEDREYFIDDIGCGCQLKSLPFTDTQGHFAEPYIKELFRKNIVQGRSETAFEPDGTLNRAEATKLVLEGTVQKTNFKTDLKKVLEDYPHYTYISFPDVPLDSWFAMYVLEAHNRAIVQGIDGMFKPGQEVTRAEFLSLLFSTDADFISANNTLTNRLGTEYRDDPNVFKDIPALGWYSNFVYYAALQGIIDAQPYFNPHRVLTRGEAAKMLSLYLDTKKVE